MQMIAPVEIAGASAATTDIAGSSLSGMAVAGSAPGAGADGKSWQEVLAEFCGAQASPAEEAAPVDAAAGASNSADAEPARGSATLSPFSAAQLVPPGDAVAATEVPAVPCSEPPKPDPVQSISAPSKSPRRIAANDASLESNPSGRKTGKSDKVQPEACVDPTLLTPHPAAPAIPVKESTPSLAASTNVVSTLPPSESGNNLVSTPFAKETLPEPRLNLASSIGTVAPGEAAGKLVVSSDTAPPATSIVAATPESQPSFDHDRPSPAPLQRVDEDVNANPAVGVALTPSQDDIAHQVDLSREVFKGSPVRGGAAETPSAPASAPSGRPGRVSPGDAIPVVSGDSIVLRPIPVHGTAPVLTQPHQGAVEQPAMPAMVSHAPASAERDTFAALDASSGPSHATWSHASAGRAEAGYLDPSLGWVSVRAEVHGSGVHASVVPGSGEAATVLGSQMAALNAYLNEHRSATTVTLATPESGSSFLDTASHSQGGYQQSQEQRERASSGAGNAEVNTVEVPAASKVVPNLSLPAALYGKGARISVMA